MAGVDGLGGEVGEAAGEDVGVVDGDGAVVEELVVDDGALVLLPVKVAKLVKVVGVRPLPRFPPLWLKVWLLMTFAARVPALRL